MTSKTDVNSKNNLNPGLYLIATPIGNLSDLSERACNVLQNVDIIACEDTRITKKLLGRYNIKTKTQTYHEHNATSTRPKLIKQIQMGKSIGLVSDAGTPTISDPGYKLVKECIRLNLNLNCIPGPSAAISGLILSGLPTNRFFFAGFLKPKSTQKRRELIDLSNISETLIFFESNRRLLNTLQIMMEVLGNRSAAIVREMTKLHEEVRRGQLSSLILHYKTHGLPKGEIVIIVGGRTEKQTITDKKLDQIIAAHLQKLSLRDATETVALQTNTSKRQIYARALRLKKQTVKNNN